MGAVPVVGVERRWGGLWRRALAVIGVTLGFVAFAAEVQAQSTIKRPGARTPYAFELEPHLAFGAIDPPGSGRSSGVGLGLRGTIELAPDGFIPKLNDSVGIGFGLDWLQYEGYGWGRCERFESGPNGTRICTEVDGGDATYFILPVVMQWNFWLTRHFSVFGEPGLFIYVDEGDFGFDLLSVSLGGRWHFSKPAALTLRLGYPTVTLGVSFFL